MQARTCLCLAISSAAKASICMRIMRSSSVSLRLTFNCSAFRRTSGEGTRSEGTIPMACKNTLFLHAHLRPSFYALLDFHHGELPDKASEGSIATTSFEVASKTLRIQEQ